MISPKYHQILQRKAANTEIRQLTHDVQKSRIAVENITKFQVGEGKFKDKIEHLQNDLQSSITSISIQSKRHKVLCELISILKGQMFKYQKTKKKEQQAEQALKDKLIGKFQYQIDQILQKHNEQIAKINNLKDLANSRRSQRVVYSSLFKKLQKQLKYYEEIYKEQLIISQFIKSKPKFVNNDFKEYKEQKQLKSITQPRQFFQTEQKKKSLQQSFNVRVKGQARFSLPREKIELFLTSHKEQTSLLKVNTHPLHPNQKKFHLTNDFGQDRSQKTSFYREQKQQKFAHTKQILKKISQYSNLIQRLKVYSEGSNTEQILHHYSSIEAQNKSLMQQIAQCDEQIEQISKLNKTARKSMAIEEVSIKKKNSEIINTAELLGVQLINHRTNKNIQDNNKLQIQLEDIAEILNIQLQKNQSNVILDESLVLLDKKITLLLSSSQNLPSLKSHTRQCSHRQDTMFSESLVDCLLDRMDKFTNCERILDKQLFQQEYYKELGKKRQIKSRKQATR